jgi:cell wall-associated NlpC family hydrolase
VARLRPAVLLSALATLGACGSVAPRPPPPAPPLLAPATAPPTQAGAAIEGGGGAALVQIAASLVGTRYQFGGADEAGFDCSGLAFYVHERMGITIPRTAAEQQRAARPVALAQLAPGDLVFFSSHAHRVDHVGIYAGFGRFIHAPHEGVPVSYAELESGYYAHHFVSAGRFWN